MKMIDAPAAAELVAEGWPFEEPLEPLLKRFGGRGVVHHPGGPYSGRFEVGQGAIVISKSLLLDGLYEEAVPDASVVIILGDLLGDAVILRSHLFVCGDIRATRLIYGGGGHARIAGGLYTGALVEDGHAFDVAGDIHASGLLISGEVPAEGCYGQALSDSDLVEGISRREVPERHKAGLPYLLG